MFREGYKNESAPQSSYYEILNVPPDASEEDISQAFWNLSKEHHPDKGGDLETYQRMSEAYNCLRKSETRKAYDEKLRFDTRRSEPFRQENNYQNQSTSNQSESSNRNSYDEAKRQEALDRIKREVESMDKTEADRWPPSSPFLHDYDFTKGNWEEHTKKKREEWERKHQEREKQS